MSTRDRGANRARQRARDLLIQALYQWQLAGNSLSELAAQYSAEPAYSTADQDYFQELLEAVLQDVEALDTVIAAQADRDIAQLDPVGRAVLLLALTEFKYRPDVPTKVVINEAVELAKRYGPAESYRFVNALLDRVASAPAGRAMR
jgi:N utilization substance protein B